MSVRIKASAIALLSALLLASCSFRTDAPSGAAKNAADVSKEDYQKMRGDERAPEKKRPADAVQPVNAPVNVVKESSTISIQ